MLEQRADGVLISAASGTKPSAFQPFVDAGIPVVQVLRAVDARRFDYVSGDNRLGVSFATEHLLKLGHRRVAYLGTSVRRRSPRSATAAMSTRWRATASMSTRRW